MSDNRAQIEIVASTSRLPAALRVATKMLQGFAAGAQYTLQHAAVPLRDIVARAAGHALGNLATRGIDILVDQGKGVLDFEEKLVRFGLASRKSGAELREVGNAARTLSSQTGIGADEVLRGARAYVDLAGAEAFTTDKMSLLARSAQASGSDIGDMATVVYSLQNALGIDNSQLEDTIGGLLNQSKDGSVHFAQMAQEIIALAPQFAQFGVKGREGAIQLAAQLQIVRSGFGSVSEAGTGLMRLYRSLPQHAPGFAKAGVNIFEPGSKTKLRPFEDILHQIQKSKLALDRAALIKTYGRSEGERAYQLLTQLVGKYDELKEAGKANGVVQKDLLTYQESSSGKIAISMERMKNAIAEAFTPERIAKFASVVSDLADKVGPLAESIGKIGGVLGGLYGAGKAIRGALTPDESTKLWSPSIDEIQSEAKNRGISEYSALMGLQADHMARTNAQDEIAAAMKDEKTTPESDKLAVSAMFAPHNEAGWSGRQSAGSRYIEAAGLSPERVADILKQVRQEAVDKDIAEGRNRTTAGSPTLASMTKSDLTEAFRDALRSSSGQPIELKVGQSVLAKTVDNDPGRRR